VSGRRGFLSFVRAVNVLIDSFCPLKIDVSRRTHKAVINALEWSRNGHLVATAGGDGLVRLFDIRTFKELEPLKGHPKEVTCESCGRIANNRM
jgi:WD40 repeat protein